MVYKRFDKNSASLANESALGGVVKIAPRITQTNY